MNTIIKERYAISCAGPSQARKSDKHPYKAKVS